MRPFQPTTIGELASRYTVLMNQINRCAPGRYPAALCLDVLHLIREAERWVVPRPAERDVLRTARTLGERGDAKGAMLKLHDVINARR